MELLKQGSEEEIQQSIANLQYPLISKPLDKYGSRGIFIIHHSDEVRKKALQTAEYTDCQEILVEEYNDGYEFNMMTWVMDGKVNVISIADREKTEMEEGMLPLSTRNVYPSRSWRRSKKVPQIFCRIISAIPDRWKVHYPCSFSGNLAGAFRYVRLQDVSLDMNMS